MRRIKLLIDFGSTFTKVVAVDMDRAEVLSRVQVPSTVREDVTIGLTDALKKIDMEFPVRGQKGVESLACSSAAGGLQIVSVGFVPELTVEALPGRP